MVNPTPSLNSRTDHHDYPPGSTVNVLIAGPTRARWLSATFIGTTVGVQMSAMTHLVVQTRDGRIWATCAPECVRAR